ncbi:MAG TPA: class I SAM-dependent methyltransferase [Desulfatiglandales bacterium]|nr:class I SAM-dependent methyltransferase [Desulfatiglandales bacterium]
MRKLSSTSALVLLWAQQECYQSKKARDYLSRLDLEDGKIFYERCMEIWPHYDEVIKNRKFGVLTLIKKCCAEKINGQQLIIAGAGFDALGIEVTEHYPHVKVFEIDNENIDIKSCLVAKLGNESKGIAFIKVNLFDSSDVHRSLSAHGWDPAMPTLLILEGISYYLPTELIQKLVQVINPEWTIFEFLKQYKEIATDRVNIPKKVFGLISSLCELSHISQYNYSQLEELADNISISAKYSMKRLEKMRTGSNRFFPTEDSGWIEVCLLANRKRTEREKPLRF